MISSARRRRTLPAAFRPVATTPTAFTAASRHAVVAATALAPDLFRLRLGRGDGFAEHPSWAVVKSDWPVPEARVRVTARAASLETSAGRLRLDLQSGAWRVDDSYGLRVFEAAAGATGFEGGQPFLKLQLTDTELLFGLGEATGTFNRRGTVRDFWNVDVLGHAPGIHPALRQLYVSIPFALSLREGRAAGLFWDNPTRQTWDLGNSRLDTWAMTATSGELDLYLFLGPTAAGINARYAELTGAMPLPPLWALGYHQSRYSYESRARLEQVAREFRRRRLPCDALYLDIHHPDGHRVFTFGKTYPQPAQMTAKLARQGFKVVAIADPGVRDDPKFGVLKRGVKQQAFVKAADGHADFVGEVWPGAARFPDFLNQGARDWWGNEQRALLDAGVAGVWNDMNEPANFARPDKTLAPDALHHTDQGPRRHAEVHNLYGMQMARASREGMLRTAKQDAGGKLPEAPAGNPATCNLQPATFPVRPFVITRAGYAGIQRHALVWTGDNTSCWAHLDDAVQMLLNLSLSGVPFCGADVGGFLENCPPELFTRWFQFAALTPFFRGHTNTGTRDHEPWAFGPAVEEICRTYLGLRYQLLPTLYGLFAEARATGAPVMRPLLWHYQNDPVAVACGDQFLLGRDLLVAPVLRPGAVARSVYLPYGLWYDFWTGEQFKGGNQVLADAPLENLPLFVRAGAILPLAEPRQFVDDSLLDAVSLHVWPQGSGELAWHEDDGATQGYEAGEVSRRTITSRTCGRTLTLCFGEAEGPFASRVKVWRVVIWDAKKPARLRLNGRPAEGSHNPETGIFMTAIGNTPAAFDLEFVGV